MLSCDSHARSASAPPGTEPAGPVSSFPGAHWFALRLRSRAEFVVQAALRAADIPEFLPVYTTESRWTDRTVTTTRPLFSGYIFAKFPASPRFVTQVKQLNGVADILAIDGRPAPIADEEIEILRKLTENPGAVSPCAYVAGDPVTVARGPFAGVSGVIASVKHGATGPASLTIPVEILGRAVRVEIEIADVTKD